MLRSSLVSTRPSQQPGDDAPKCGAKRTGSDETCGNPAGYRTAHPGRGPCARHFGCTPHIVSKYIIEEAMENATAAGFRGIEVEIGPHEALLEEVRRTAGKVRYLGDYLDFTELDKDTTIRIEREFRWERSHLVAVCGVAARAGVEERAVRIAEQWGAELATVMGRIFVELQLTEAQRAIAPAIVSKHLQLMESAA